MIDILVPSIFAWQRYLLWTQLGSLSAMRMRQVFLRC